MRLKSSLVASVAAVLYAVALYYVWDVWRAELLLVGDVTIDEVLGRSLAGGSITYAAAVAAGLGTRACVVTAAGPDADLTVFAPHDLTLIPTPTSLVFQHTYTWWGNQRKLRVPSVPSVELNASHVPWRCRLARTVVIGPLIQNDVDAASFSKPDHWLAKAVLPFQRIALMAQGYQRGTDPQGKVFSYHYPSDKLKHSLTSQVILFLSDVETDPWEPDAFDRVIKQVHSFVVTRGEEGASVYRYKQKTYQIPANRINPVDTNGAGDTFAMAYMLGGTDMIAAGTHAAWAASQVCLQPQSCKPHCVEAALKVGVLARGSFGNTSVPDEPVLPVHADIVDESDL